MKLGQKEIMWLRAALSRAVRTMCQVMLTYLTLGAVIKDIDWKQMISAGVVGFAYSMLMSAVKRPPESKDIADGGTIELENPLFDGDSAHVSFKLNQDIDQLEDGAKITFKCIDNMDDEYKENFKSINAVDFDKDKKE